MFECPGDVCLFNGNVTRNSQDRFLVVEHVPIRFVPGASVQEEAHVVEIQHWVKLEWKNPKEPLHIPMHLQTIGDIE
jgi:hypothetical protein